MGDVPSRRCLVCLVTRMGIEIRASWLAQAGD
jgi:hypothetical protein